MTAPKNGATLFLGYGRQGHGVTRSFPDSIPLDVINAEMFGWDVIREPLVARTEAGDVPIPGKVALTRHDVPPFGNSHVLGISSARYAPHQYRDSLTGGLRKILGDGLAIDAAGMTGHGAKAWVSVSLADTVCTPEGVEFLPRIIAYGSHDLSLPTGYKRSALLMICNNMVSLMLRDRKGSEAGYSEVKVRHTANSVLRLESAQQALGILSDVEDEFSAQVRELCEQEVTKQQWADFLRTYVAIADDMPLGRGRTLAENKRDELHALYTSDDRCAQWQGTAWGVVQTVNTYDHWHATVRNADRAERNAERMLTSHYDSLDRDTLATLDRVLAGATV